MARIQSHATVQSIAANAFGEVERRIICDRGRVHLSVPVSVQQLLNSRKLRDRERALQGVVASGVEKNYDGGVTSKELIERD